MQKHNVCLRKWGWAWLYLAGGGVNSFRVLLGWRSSGPKAEGSNHLRRFVTPSFVTTISSMNGADLSRSGTWSSTVLVYKSVN